MSLYTHDEVCKGCIFSKWISAEEFWDNKKRFARCTLFAESSVDSSSGECLQKEEKED